MTPTKMEIKELKIYNELTQEEESVTTYSVKLSNGQTVEGSDLDSRIALTKCLNEILTTALGRQREEIIAESFQAGRDYQWSLREMEAGLRAYPNNFDRKEVRDQHVSKIISKLEQKYLTPQKDE